MNRRKIQVLFSIVTAFLLLCSVHLGKSEAASLFQPNGSMANLFSDYKARQVGDTVTIIISESSSSTQKASTSSTKKNAIDSGTPTVGSDSNVINTFFKKVFPIENNSSSKFSGDGSTSRSGSLNAQMTAVVMEVLPNGNLVIEGTQKISVNAENQEITIKGTVRPVDISPDNTVLSTAVANAEIKYKGKGTVGDSQKPGILTRIFHWFF